MRRKKIFRRRNVKRQKWRLQYRKFLKWGALLGLLVGVGLGVSYGMKHLQFFAVKKIDIRGDPQTLSQAEILRRIAVPMGTNLFRINLDQIKGRLKGHEYFKAIYVQRRLPQTLVVALEEFRPQLLLYTGRFYYVDATGEIFKDVTQTKDNRDFVILTGVREEEILMQPHRVKKWIQKALDLKSNYLKTPFAKKFGLSEIHLEKNIGFTLYPEGQKYSIKFGEKNFSKKTDMLSQVMEKLEEEDVKFSSIDLNYPGKVLMTL